MKDEWKLPNVVHVRNGRFDPTTAETIAIVHTLRFCNEIGLSSIYVEGDAKNVVEALNSSEINWSNSGHLAANAQLLLQKFTQWKVQFVSREANFAARNLAKLAAQMGLNRTWLGEISDCISEIIRVEQIAVSSSSKKKYSWRYYSHLGNILSIIT